ncbi:MAG: hypothetical protein WD404_01770 [Solirubrobacterales bacterium]
MESSDHRRELTREFSIRAITVDQVIASKEALGRPKDLAALPALRAAQEARGDY